MLRYYVRLLISDKICLITPTFFVTATNEWRTLLNIEILTWARVPREEAI